MQAAQAVSIYTFYMLHLSSKETLNKRCYFWHFPTLLVLPCECNLILSYVSTTS